MPARGARRRSGRGPKSEVRGPTQRLRALAIDQLRAVGVRPGEITAAFGKRLATRDVVALYLAALDHAHARAGRAAAALRAALDRDTIDPAALVRRLDALARAAALERDGHLLGAVRGTDALHTSVVEAAFRDLPGELTDAQWDAVIELVALLADRDLAARAGDDPTRIFELGATPVSRKLLDDLFSQAHGAWVRGDPPASRRGRVLATRWVNHAASLARVSMHTAAGDLLDRARDHDPRIEHVWALVGIIRGWSGPPAHLAAFRWLIEAVRAHRPQFGR